MTEVAGPRVLALVGERDGPCLWRIMSPFAELQRQGYSAEWGYKDDPRLALLVEHFDAVILPRLNWKPEDWDRSDRWMDALHAAGKAAIYEVDDDTFTEGFVRRLIESHDKEPARAASIAASAIRALRACDGVTVSSQRLATVVRQYTDCPVVVVPNAIDLPWWRAVQRVAKRAVPELTIGWAGGVRPDKDVLPMLEAWARIAERFPAVRFVVMGHQPQALRDRLPMERIVQLPWMPLESYPLGYKSIDIGCCPLSSEPFNRAKTPIKSYEYAASGAAVVASPTVYGQVIERGVDGYICETADEWEAALARLVESHSHRQILAGRLLRKVEKQHSLSVNAWRWPAAWTQIVEAASERTGRRLISVGA